MQELCRRKLIGVAIQQRWYPHYRQAIFRALSAQADIDFTVIRGDHDSHGMVNVEDELVHCAVGPSPQIGHPRSPFWSIPHMVEFACTADYDVMLLQNDFTCLSLWPTWRAVRKRGKRLVIYSPGFGQYRQRLRDWARIRMAHRADALLLYSFKNAQRYIDAGVPAEKVFVGPNAVDTTAIRNAEANISSGQVTELRRKHELRQGRTLIHVGRLIRRKRLDLLIQALVLLRKQYSDIKLVLIGEGDEQRVLQEQAVGLGVNSHIIWTGAITNADELCPWFRASDLCVAPGQQGLITNLCHGYGVPLVVCDDPIQLGPEIQVFTDGRTGLVYRFRDVAHLAEKISALLDDTKTRKTMAQEARRVIHSDFTLERQLDGFLSAIRYAVAQRAGDNRT